jgi:hypothetical protein
MVVHLGWGRYRYRTSFGQEAHLVLGRRSSTFEARGIVRGKPIRQELVDGTRFENVAGQDMCADFGALFQDYYAELFITGLMGELL